MILEKINNHCNISIHPNITEIKITDMVPVYNKYKYVAISENLIEIIKSIPGYYFNNYMTTLKNDDYLIFMNPMMIYFKEDDNIPLQFTFSFKHNMPQPTCFKVNSKKYYRLRKLKTIK